MTNIYEIITRVISGTPTWVFAIFIYLIFIGTTATREKTIHLPKLFIIPAVLIGMKYKIFCNIELVSCLLLSLIIGFLPGFFSGLKTKIQIFKDSATALVPGNYHTLTILLLFFFSKYSLGYLMATTTDHKYLFLDTSISAILSGYFLGRAAAYYYRFLKS